MNTSQEKQCSLYKKFYRRIKRLEKRRGNKYRLLPISLAGCDREFAVNVWCHIYEMGKSLKAVRS